MNAYSKRALVWAPRTICIIVAAFSTLISLDSFEGHGLVDGLGRFAVHMLPTYVLIGMLLLSWRREWVGAAVSCTLGTLFLWWNHATHRNAPGVAFVIAAPFFLMGVLYLANWLARRQLPQA